MVDRIAPAPSLTPTASPVDRFVTPEQQYADPNTFMSGIADALQTLNPELQRYMRVHNEENAAAQEAEGAQAESGIDARHEFQKGRESWRQMIDSERKRDVQNGTNNADRLAGASPHFRRGLVKARLNRIGMGLNDHLMNLWRDNPVIETPEGPQHLQDVDDPAALQQWVTGNTAEYTERFGVGNMDPLLVGENLLPRVSAAQDGFLSRHTEFRLQRYNEEYMTEMSSNIGMVMAGGGSNASSVDDFLNRLGSRESSGNDRADNGLGYVGRVQFGQARLDDYNRAKGTNYTLEQFRNNSAVQRDAEVWHINDIDAAIEAGGYIEEGWSLDGLRAVAHLGGTPGMRKFVAGGYNPKDEFGTHLSDYYNKFSGSGAAVQEIANNARADGMNPTQINKAVVDSIILTARQTGNPAVLDQLDTIDTGNGPIGNIGWVREARFQAEQQIESANYTRDQREAAAQTAADKAQATAMKTDAFRTMLENPFADTSQLKQQALDAGNPQLAEDIGDIQRKLITDDTNVITDHEVVTALSLGIVTGELDKDEAMEMIWEGVGQGKFKSDVARQLIGDLENNGGAAKELINDRIVRDTLDDVRKIVGDRFKLTVPFGPSEPGTEQAVQAERWMKTRLSQWVIDNPQATPSEGRAEADRLFDMIIKGPRFQAPPPDQPIADTPEPYGQRAASQDTFMELIQMANGAGLADPASQTRINQLATEEGLTAQQFMVKYGIAPQQ